MNDRTMGLLGLLALVLIAPAALSSKSVKRALKPVIGPPWSAIGRWMQ